MKFTLLVIMVLLISCKENKNTEETVFDMINEKIETNIISEEIVPITVTELTDTNIDFFANDMFINIFSEPELYKNDTLFSFNEYFPDFAHKGTPQKYIEVENDKIKIVYYPDDFSKNGKYEIMFVTLKKENDKYYLGNFFGMEYKKILQIVTNVPEYSSIRLDGKGEIGYCTSGYQFFIRFSFENGVVNLLGFNSPPLGAVQKE